MLGCHEIVDMSFTIKSEKQKKITIVEVQIIRDNKTFINSVYRNPTFSVVYTHFDNFSLSTYKCNTVSTLLYRFLRICSRWTKLDNELVCLRESFFKNDYPQDFISKRSKKIVDNTHVVKEATLRVKKKFLVLFLLYIG